MYHTLLRVLRLLCGPEGILLTVPYLVDGVDSLLYGPQGVLLTVPYPIEGVEGLLCSSEVVLLTTLYLVEGVESLLCSPEGGLGLRQVLLAVLLLLADLLRDHLHLLLLLVSHGLLLRHLVRDKNIVNSLATLIVC